MVGRTTVGSEPNNRVDRPAEHDRAQRDRPHTPRVGRRRHDRRAYGVPKLDRALERGGLPLSRGRSLPALLETRGLHASVGFERLLAALTLAASAPDRIKAPHRVRTRRSPERALSSRAVLASGATGRHSGQRVPERGQAGRIVGLLLREPIAIICASSRRVALIIGSSWPKSGEVSVTSAASTI